MSTGTPSFEEVLGLIKDFSRATDARIMVVEAQQQALRTETIDKIARSEQAQADAMARLIPVLESLARLESVPNRLEDIDRHVKESQEKLRAELQAMGRAMVARLQSVEKRVQAIEKRHEAEDVEHETRSRTVNQGVRAGAWFLENGWKVAAALAGLTVAGGEVVDNQAKLALLERAAAHREQFPTTRAYAPIPDPEFDGQLRPTSP